ncbi:Isoleucine N-monooxygenase 1 [Acorus gramineus]|uniref:Isoleucine N-monooxygenase 1 n=1 Tax=Acorus gramineus TaxID=55184 RepID=A0AAV9AX72_ACOGR|nr:Isoleucine N-monooxygenase 1 [Acorus gramineus]
MDFDTSVIDIWERIFTTINGDQKTPFKGVFTNSIASNMSSSSETNAGLIVVLLTNPTTTSLILLFYLLYQYNPIRKPKPLPPGPKPWPIVGSLPELYRNKPIFRWVLSLPKNTPRGVA